MRWHHRLNGHEFKQTSGDSKGQGAWGAGIQGSQRLTKKLNNNKFVLQLKNSCCSSRARSSLPHAPQPCSSNAGMGGPRLWHSSPSLASFPPPPPRFSHLPFVKIGRETFVRGCIIQGSPEKRTSKI